MEVMIFSQLLKMQPRANLTNLFFPSSSHTNKLDYLALLSLIFASKAEAYRSGALNGAQET
jgi:hypothetical protein